MVPKLVVAVLLVSAAAAGCGSSSPSGTPTSTSRPSTTSSSTTPDPSVAVPVGANPSASAVMICADEAQRDIAKALSVPATRVTTPTWVDNVYSCQYVYPTGVITLSVKELSNAAETTAYFDQLRQSLGQKASVGLGGGAFHTNNGSLVVRKDYKVLLVDVSKAPKQFGKFRVPAVAVALNVGGTIMGCWTGA
ncbi:MAG: hypothetical protein ACXVKA_01835 [Acidimicrobiia bacterium]